MEKVDTEKLLQLLPEEIWLQILSLEFNSEHLFALTNASCFFRRLLLPKMILTILDEQKLFKQSDCRSLLQLRLVCKSWNAGVNHLLQNRPHHQKILFSSYYHSCNLDFVQPIYFRPHLIRKWNKLDKEIVPCILQCPNHNPFPARHFEFQEEYLTMRMYHPVGFSHNDMITGNRSKIFRFLQAAGQHFWYARIQIAVGERTTVTEFYNALAGYIRLLPNLKSLYIKFPYFSFSCPAAPINSSPIPALENMQLLEIECTPNAAIDAILAANHGVKILSIIDASNENYNLFEPERRQIPPNFSLVHDPSTVSFRNISLDAFGSLPAEWKLRKLRLEFNQNSFVDWQIIFSKLEIYSGTLTELNLKLPQAVNQDQKNIVLKCTRKPLNLRKLKKLYFTAQNHCSLDFLLGMDNLNHLYIDLWNQDRQSFQGDDNNDAEQDAIDFDIGRVNSFMECNIWDKIPTLTMVSPSTASRRIRRFRRGVSANGEGGNTC